MIVASSNIRRQKVIRWAFTVWRPNDHRFYTPIYKRHTDFKSIIKFAVRDTFQQLNATIHTHSNWVWTERASFCLSLLVGNCICPPHHRSLRRKKHVHWIFLYVSIERWRLKGQNHARFDLSVSINVQRNINSSEYLSNFCLETRPEGVKRRSEAKEKSV